MIALGYNDLIKDSGKPRKTIVLVGNGAVESGGVPLRAILDQMIMAGTNSTEVKSLRCKDAETFHQLAILSYKFKIKRAHQYLAWKNAIETPKQTEAKGLDSFINGFLHVRSSIAAEYLKYAGKITVRESPQIKELIGDDAAYVTTNWDETFWNDATITDIVQFHGRCTYDHSIVFPTELLIEDTPYDLTPFMSNISTCSTKFQDSVYSTFRSHSMIALMVHVIETVSKWLSGCERLVIWGYSLGDYDADVNAILATYVPENLKELIVINPDPAAFRRAIALTGVTKTYHFDPITRIKLKLE